MDDLEWAAPVDDPTRPERPPRTCRHPRYGRLAAADGTGAQVCGSCGKQLDPIRARRGRTSRNRGNAIEREMAAHLGLRRVGQFGGPDDLAGELFAAQVKSGGSFPERFWKWLKAVPVKAGQTALLVVTDAPGPGHRRRAVVVVDLDDWRQLHGRDSDEGIQGPDPYPASLR